MIVLSVNEKEYKAFQNWSEVPLSLAVRVHKLCLDSMPARLKDIYKILASEIEDKDKELKKWYASITDIESIKEFPTFYGKVIALLTNIPEDVINHIQPAHRSVFYKKYCELFVFGILHFPTNLELKHIKSFKHGDLPELFLPETKNVMGQDKPFFDRTAIEFSEAADLEIYSKQLDGGRFEIAVNIISILCRPKRKMDGLYPKEIEAYNEETCLKRAEKLKDLPMDTVFEVFFCLGIHISIYNTIMATSFIQEARRFLQSQNQVESKGLDGTHTSLKHRGAFEWLKKQKKQTSTIG